MNFEIAITADVGETRLEVRLDGEGAPVALIGPNGSGKTTLLRILAGAIRPSTGKIRVGQHVIFDSKRAIDVAVEERRVGYVPQGYGLFPHLRVVDNVAFGLPHSLSRADRRGRALAQLTALGCSHLASRLPARLSGGEQQRVALARAFAAEPLLLLLDEPLAALDVSARQSMRRFLSERLREMNRPSIVVTHDVRDVRELDALVAVMEGGRIVQRGTLAQVARSPVNDFVAEFVSADAPSNARVIP